MNKNITIEIPKKVLQDIEDNIQGKDQNEKLVKCIAKGFETLTEKDANARTP